MLLRLNAAAEVWRLLAHRPDPRLRTYVVERLSSYGVDVLAVWQQSLVQDDPSILQAILLAVGDYVAAGLLSEEQRQAIASGLVQVYMENPDPGVHAAAEWALRKMGRGSQIADVRSRLATGQVIGKRGWYVTKQGQLTMVILQPKEFFSKGKTITDVQRIFGESPEQQWPPTGHRFAIAAHEVTIDQFKAFRSTHEFSAQIAHTGDAPAHAVNWYEAAEFCNWLSREEEIPREQWCYDPTSSFADGMRLYPDYRQRTGYRLPTMIEWETAFRADTKTAFPWGPDDVTLRRNLETHYANFESVFSGKDNELLPVGSLKPNEFGLFDMLGNIDEWCANRGSHWSNSSPYIFNPMAEDELLVGARRDQRAVVGGSFSDSHLNPNLESLRRGVEPRDRGPGFRVARTLP